MTNDEIRKAEKELYAPLKEYLNEAFERTFERCHLEITAQGYFSEELKCVVRNDIIFSFLGRKVSPDLTGFISRKESLLEAMTPSNIQDFITVEIKAERITLQDIYQAKMYGDLFEAKYALLISPKPIPEEIKRLNQRLFITHRYGGRYIHIGRWLSGLHSIIDWLPKSPY